MCFKKAAFLQFVLRACQEYWKFHSGFKILLSRLPASHIYPRTYEMSCGENQLHLGLLKFPVHQPGSSPHKKFSSFLFPWVEVLCLDQALACLQPKSVNSPGEKKKPNWLFSAHIWSPLSSALSSSLPSPHNFCSLPVSSNMSLVTCLAFLVLGVKVLACFVFLWPGCK